METGKRGREALDAQEGEGGPVDDQAGVQAAAGAGAGDASATRQGAAAKRQRPDSKSTALVVAPDHSGAIVLAAPKGKRTSSLESPIMALEGESIGGLLAGDASPEEHHLAVAGMDGLVYLWEFFGENRNFSAMRGHKNAVTDLHWSADGKLIFTASADKTLGIFDAEYGKMKAQFEGHRAYVYSCSARPTGDVALASASQDGTVRLWDARLKHSTASLEHDHAATAVAYAYDGATVFTGSLDGVVRQWDLRRHEVVHELEGHTNIVTDLCLSKDGGRLLSNSSDETLRIWNVANFAVGDRCERELKGPKHGVNMNLLHCCWSPSGARVAAGSADRNCYVWDAVTGELEYCLPGHKGACTATFFHSSQPVIGTTGLDGVVWLGELTEEQE